MTALVFEDDTRCDVPPAGWICTRTHGHEGACAAWPEETPATPRTEAVIDECMRRFQGTSVRTSARYFEEVHQALAPLCRELEAENAKLRAATAIPPHVAEVLAEIERATAKFPTWPTDPLHAVAVVGEESGELVKAVLQAVYEPHKSGPADVREEAVQAAAMCLRFIASADRYVYARGEQHSQSDAGGAA